MNKNIWLMGNSNDGTLYFIQFLVQITILFSFTLGLASLKGYLSSLCLLPLSLAIFPLIKPVKIWGRKDVKDNGDKSNE